MNYLAVRHVLGQQLTPKRNLLISFSGGETSAYMTWRILNDPALRSRWGHVKVVFANTGEENEETLDFVRECDAVFGFDTVWVETVQYHNERKSAGFKIVNYETASRSGDPFTDVIRKFGIPNKSFPHCTRELKQRPIEAFTRSIGWGAPGNYDTAIGIRSDEVDRISATATDRGIIYPLATHVKMTKPKINFWWSLQPFRLRLRHWEGNCKWCWKKSNRKHMTLIRHTPSVFDFPRAMENQYGAIGAEFRRDPPPENGYRRTFFRGNASVDDLFTRYAILPASWQEASDESQVFDPDMDVAAACGESCEVYADNDEERP